MIRDGDEHQLQKFQLRSEGGGLRTRWATGKSQDNYWDCGQARSKEEEESIAISHGRASIA